MAWTIKYTPKALRQLRGLDRPVADRIERFFAERVVSSDDPYNLATQLTDCSGRWRFRVGDHRAICKIVREQLIVEIVKVGHRKEIYG